MINYERMITPPNPRDNFEVNLVEPLVGWRMWAIYDIKIQRMISSLYYQADWFPDQPIEAECFIWEAKHPVPGEDCTCGIYANDKRTPEMRSGWSVSLGKICPHIIGEVYGWGRYVRCDEGWKAQFAYPKAFYFEKRTAPDMVNDIFDTLKLYHVPIFDDELGLIYNPEEDGYEYWQKETNRYLGTASDSDTKEDPKGNTD